MGRSRSARTVHPLAPGGPLVDVDCLAALAAAGRSIDCACPKCKGSSRPAQVAAVVPGDVKPGRGGKRANQKGRPPTLREPVTRSFTLERDQLAVLEAFAVQRRRKVSDLAREVFQLGLDALDSQRGNGLEL